VTDGLRIYFQEGSGLYPKVVQVSVNGGQTSPVPMRFKYADLNDLAPDASALLISPTDDQSKWIQPLPAGEPRSLGFGSDSARFLPDGRIIFAEGPSVYMMNADGSRRKLAEAPGQALNPAASPDGKRIRFTVIGDNLHYSIWEIKADGAGLHRVPMAGLPETIGEAAGNWTQDGKYFLFQTEHRGRWDLWALPENTRFSDHPSPLQLTNGPLSYESPVATRDGKQIFVVGSKKRGELVRYDTKSQQFVPWLSGISAVESRVSPDGKWIIYVSYPDRALWRSRSDGTDRVQLTFPPLMVFYPKISPDGRKVAFSGLTASSGLGVYVLKIEGGTPEKVVDQVGHAPTWSPDGDSLAFGAIVPGRHLFDESHWCEIHLVDLRTKQVSVLPTVEDRFGPWWPRPDKLVAASTLPSNEPYLFDFETQKWSKIGEGFQVDNWAPSADGKYLYLLTSGKEGPKVRRIRSSDFKVEVIADIEGLRLVSDDTLGQASSGGWIGIAADGSPTLTHDVGSDEIYALDVKWP
jgi:Tol biopolymer transport system component